MSGSKFTCQDRPNNGSSRKAHKSPVFHSKWPRIAVWLCIEVQFSCEKLHEINRKVIFRFGVWFLKFGQFSIEVDSTEFGLFWIFRLASESVLIGFKSFRIGSTDFVSFEAFILGAILWDFQPLESIQFVFWAYPIANWRLTGHYRNFTFSKLGNVWLNHWRSELTASLLKFLGIRREQFAGFFYLEDVIHSHLQ